jgi:hypothetical protein
MGMGGAFVEREKVGGEEREVGKEGVCRGGSREGWRVRVRMSFLV